MVISVSLRPAEAADDALMYQLYASTRAAEMALVDWSAQQKEAFLQMQLTAQRQSYGIQFPRAEWLITMAGGEAIGRLIVDRSSDDILLMDITLLPERRNAGIGTALIRDLQQEAAGVGKPLRLHVETFNPALRLYTRLGFVKVGEFGFYNEMEWRAPGSQTASAVGSAP